MNATTNEARFAGIGAVENEQVSDATRAAQYGILNEAAGAIFTTTTLSSAPVGSFSEPVDLPSVSGASRSISLAIKPLLQMT